MPKKIFVAIIGAGDMGQAIAGLVTRPFASVDLWDAEEGKVPNQQPMENIISRADVVFFCVPSWALGSAVRACVPHLKPKAVVVSISKGIEGATGKTMDAYWPCVLPEGQPFALLIGPMLAREIREGLGAAAMVAVKDRKTFTRVASLFDGNTIRLEYTRDVKGMALVSVLKNIYSLAMGVADGLGWGGNRQGWLAGRAIQEMGGILRDLGVKKDVLFSVAGIADFLATGYCASSHNRKSGHELVLSGVENIKSEGTVSLPPLYAQLGERAQAYPLLTILERVLVAREKPLPLFDDYFRGA